MLKSDRASKDPVYSRGILLQGLKERDANY